MTDWVGRSLSFWSLDWFGPCEANVFDAELDWPFDWFDECASGLAGSFGGYGPDGVYTFVLDLANGFTIHHSWITDVIKFRSGAEQRISRNDTARESYKGSAYLAGDNARLVRAKLARYAAIGSQFLLALPHEGLTVVGSAAGATVEVNDGALDLTDWAKPGQRVVVTTRDDDGEREFVNAVIQSVTGNEILLDVTLGLTGGCAEIMPCRAVYLEPQQSIARYRTEIETWQLDARTSWPMDFAPTLAELALGPLTTSAAFDNVKVVAREFGIVGNTRTFCLVDDPGAPDAGMFTEHDGDMVLAFKAGVTTIGDLETALAASAYGILTGSYTTTDTIAAGDAFSITPLAGGADSGAFGTGATLTTYSGDGTSRPVWDRRLDNEDTVTDGAHALTTIIDHGGIPYALGTADKADWFRAVNFESGDREDWQWFKLFMWTIKGRQKKFWLATWRDDLIYESHIGASLVVDSELDDFDAWWPHQREHVQIVQADDTVTHAKITAAVDNGDDTRTLTLSTALSASAVTKISWLELCRFEDADEYDTTHSARGFEVALIARVVP